jgi:hypothetical protein
MAITPQKWDKDATILSTLIGRTIVDIEYDGTYSAPIIIILDNGKSITIDAQGDDMAHTIVTD